MKTFTSDELSKYDGSHGITYIGYQGKVYDVSKSYHWRTGRHQVMHHGGHDLSDVLQRAPHGFDLLQKFPVVGDLVNPTS